MEWKKLFLPTLLKVLLCFSLMFIFTNAEFVIEQSLSDSDVRTRGFPITYEKTKFCLQDTGDCNFFSWAMFMLNIVFWYFAACFGLAFAEKSLTRFIRHLKKRYRFI